MAKAAKTSFALYGVIIAVIAVLFFVSKMAREGFQVMPKPTAAPSMGPTGAAPPADVDKAVDEVKKLANESHAELLKMVNKAHDDTLKKIDVVKSRHAHHGATGAHGPTEPHK
jgi:hypothetical protein